MSEAGWLSKNLILIMGKGGVGRTTFAQATARYLASKGKRTLLCHVLQLEEAEQELQETEPGLWEITLNPSVCFREYIILKVKLKSLYTIFLGNKVTQYLEKAAPGVREMVLIGKVWFERNNYDHIVVDMPSTGYALTMLNTPVNFAALFPGGPIYHDSKEMIETFTDPNQTAFVTISLPEEMPIQESLELESHLKSILPGNPSWFVMNRVVHVTPEAKELYSKRWKKLSGEDRTSPLWQGLDFLIHKEKKQETLLEDFKSEVGKRGWLEVEEIPSISEAERIEKLMECIGKTRKCTNF